MDKISSKLIKQLVVYLFVGGTAALVNWAVFYLMAVAHNINYLLATFVSFMIATWVNWWLGKVSLFKKSTVKQGTAKEMYKIYVVSAIGFGLNLLLMFIFLEKLNIESMVSLILTTGIVFLWNFLSRKYYIYRI